MTDFDSNDEDAITDVELQYNFFSRIFENLMTDESSFIIFDEDTKEEDRAVKATQVVDCIVVAMWGKTKEGKDFISLIHKSGPSSVEELMTEFREQVREAKLSYLVIPGSESGKRTAEQTKDECKLLFGENEKSELIPELRIIKNDHRYDKTSVAMRGVPNSAPSILVVRPNIGY